MTRCQKCKLKYPHFVLDYLVEGTRRTLMCPLCAGFFMFGKTPDKGCPFNGEQNQCNWQIAFDLRGKDWRVAK